MDQGVETAHNVCTVLKTTTSTIDCHLGIDWHRWTTTVFQYVETYRTLDLTSVKKGRLVAGSIWTVPRFVGWFVFWLSWYL